MYLGSLMTEFMLIDEGLPVYLGSSPGTMRCFWRRVLTTSSGLLASGPMPPLRPPKTMDSHGSSSFLPAGGNRRGRQR